MAISENTYSADFESGSSQYLSIADGSQTGLDFSASSTFAMWVKVESQPSNETINYLYAKSGSGAGNRGYYFGYYNNSGTYRFHHLVSSNGTAYTNYNSAAQTLTIGQWYHIAVVTDTSAQTIDIYVDGSSINQESGTMSAQWGANSKNFALGAYTGGSQFWDGEIDDVRVWGRALGSSEISSLYTNSCSFDNGANLGAHWTLDNVLTDLSGNGNTLTNNNTVTFTADGAFVCAAGPANLKTWNTINKA